MKEGTISVLYGVHSIVHSYYVWKAWKELYKLRPTFAETICILVHDWGYWGKNYYSERSNDGHAELGAKIAGFLFDRGFSTYHRDLVLGHSSAACKKHNILKSKLERPDEYSWLIADIRWVRWGAKIEKYTIPSEVFIEAVRNNFYAPENERRSGTEIANELKTQRK